MGNRRLSIERRIYERVDAVDEHDQPALLQALQQPEQAGVAGRKRLLRVQYSDVGVGALERFARERLSHANRIVRARRVDDRGRVGERRLSKSIDQRALTGLHMSDHDNPTSVALRLPHEAIQRSRRFVIQEWPQLGRQLKRCLRELAQIMTNSRLRGSRGLTLVSGKIDVTLVQS